MNITVNEKVFEKRLKYVYEVAIYILKNSPKMIALQKKAYKTEDWGPNFHDAPELFIPNELYMCMSGDMVDCLNQLLDMAVETKSKKLTQTEIIDTLIPVCVV